MKFAKLFERQSAQVLVMLEPSDKPNISYHFMPEGLGLSNFAISFEESDEGFEKAQKAFDAIDEESAFNHVEKMIKEVGGDDMTLFAEKQQVH